MHSVTTVAVATLGVPEFSGHMRQPSLSSPSPQNPLVQLQSCVAGPVNTHTELLDWQSSVPSMQWSIASQDEFVVVKLPNSHATVMVPWKSGLHTLQSTPADAELSMVNPLPATLPL